MSLLVAAAVAAAGVNGESGSEQDELAAAGFPKSLLPVDYSKAFSALQDDGDSPLDMVTALAQESLVILERVLTENTHHSESVGSGTPSDGTPSFVMAAPGSSGSAVSAVVSGAAGLLLRSAEAGGFVTGWPFVSGTPGSEVPSFALVAAALSSFPPRRLASDPSSPDPCAERLPALANSTLASLVRSGFPFNGDAASAPMAAAAAAAAPPPIWAGVPTAAGPNGGGGGGVVRPLADSLSPDDAYHLRQALVAAMSSQDPDKPAGGGGAAVEEKRAAALGLLLSAVKEQPALVVVLFWAQPTPPRKAGATPNVLSTPSPPTGGGETAAVVGGAALSGAVLSVLKALSVELADGQRGLAGGSESLVMALELVLGLWHAEGVGRLGQVCLRCSHWLPARSSGCCSPRYSSKTCRGTRGLGTRAAGAPQGDPFRGGASGGLTGGRRRGCATRFVAIALSSRSLPSRCTGACVPSEQRRSRPRSRRPRFQETATPRGRFPVETETTAAAGGWRGQEPRPRRWRGSSGLTSRSTSAAGLPRTPSLASTRAS
ncbi:unnamed protein product [Ectocarpus sp. 8 AP-2014]